MHEVLVNHLGGLSLPRKSVVRLTDRPDMTLDVYRVHKTTMQQYICTGGNYSICLSSQYGTTLKGNYLLLQEQILPFNSRFYFKELPHTEKHKGIHELILFSAKRRGCLLSVT